MHISLFNPIGDEKIENLLMGKFKIADCGPLKNKKT